MNKIVSPLPSPKKELSLRWPPRPIILEGIPLLYEDEEEGEMGEATLHTLATGVLFYGLQWHLMPWPQYQVFQNLNLYYDTKDRAAYVSPDVMVAAPFGVPVGDLTSYRIGETGPAPILTAEVLSKRSAQQRDLGDKMEVYALLGIPEYIVVDVMGIKLPSPLLLKRLQDDRTWLDEQDSDGGVTSQLGFRIVMDADGQIRLAAPGSGTRYPRPEEAMQELMEARAELAKRQNGSRPTKQ
jgi:Putative restriction endonuclease